MLKVALVSPYDWAYPGGVTNHIDRLSRELARLDHQVCILTPSSRPVDYAGPARLLTIGKPVPIPIAGSIARISVSLHRAPQVKDVVQREEFDVIHLHEPLVSALPWTVLQYSRAINVGTFHAYLRVSRGYRSLGPILLRRWFRRLHGKIAVSRPAAELISKYFPGYYNIIPNGIDLAHFQAEGPPIERFRDGKVNILFVGRLEKRKGLQYLLGAYGRIKWDHPDTRLIIVGPGKLDPASERTIAERGLRDVELVGGVPYDKLPGYYRSADIFCSPATGSESFGIVLLEAMAAGRPIVASHIPGYASVVQDGMEGLLVPPKDEATLAAALTRLIEQPELRRELGRQGCVRAQGYAWPRVAAQVNAYYHRLLEEFRPGT